MRKLFLCFLFLSIALLSLALHPVHANDLIASCELDETYDDGLVVSGARMVGDQVECEISCNFGSRPASESNVEEPLSPANQKFTRIVNQNEVIQISDVEIRDSCCAPRSDVCFVSPGLCYIASDPNRCSNGYVGVSADVECTYEIRWPDTIPEKRNMLREEDCDPPRCPEGTYLVDSTNRICCPIGTDYVDGQCVDPSVDGICGNAIGEYDYTESFSDEYCEQGTPEPSPENPTSESPSEWVCKGQDGGSDSVVCRATRLPPPSEPQPNDCGAAVGTYAYDSESFRGDFCSFGEPVVSVDNDAAADIEFPSPRDKETTVSWHCPGLNGGSGADCSATREKLPEEVSVCGPASESDYAYDAEDFRRPFCIPDELAESDIPEFPSPGEPATWTCPGSTTPCIVNVEEQPLGDPTCRCVLMGSQQDPNKEEYSGRKARDYRCVFYEEDGSRIQDEQHNMHIDKFHGVPIEEIVTLSDGRTATCTVAPEVGCDLDTLAEINITRGICPSNCKSWQHPDCDYGRYGLRLVDWALQMFELPPLQMMWNNVLSGDNAVGTVYSVFDGIPGTPEWFTDQVCKKGFQLSDEDACEALGLSEDECSEEWDGYENFIGDNVYVSIAADYISRGGWGDDLDEKNNYYRISWKVHNIEGEEYRVFLANLDGTPADDAFAPTHDDFYEEYDPSAPKNMQAYATYGRLPRDKLVVFPTEGGYAEISSENFEYLSSKKFEYACIEFRITKDDNLLRKVLTALGYSGTGFTGTPFTCKKIVFYN